MNLKVDFAAGGIVLENNNILLVKNRKNEYVDNPKSFWVFQKDTWKMEKHLKMPQKERL